MIRTVAHQPLTTADLVSSADDAILALILSSPIRTIAASIAYYRRQLCTVAMSMARRGDAHARRSALNAARDRICAAELCDDAVDIAAALLEG